jgi:hypothetical protein
MVRDKKKQYMKKYNQRSYVKRKKADYMRKRRKEYDKEAARNIVKMFLDFGFENLAEEFAMERAPEMLVSAKSRNLRRQRNK